MKVQKSIVFTEDTGQLRYKYRRVVIIINYERRRDS